MLSKQRVEIVFSLLLIALSVYIFISTKEMPEDAAQFPAILSVLLAISAVLLIIRNVKSRKPMPIQFNKSSVVAFLLITASLFIYYLLIQYLGYIIASLVLVFSIITINNSSKIGRNILVSVTIVAIVYFIFSEILGVPLPRTFINH